jgi:hypothetical protein
VNESRPVRPSLATIICFYLVLTAFIPLPIIWISLLGRLDSAFIYSSSLLHTPVSWLTSTLAIAAAISLWQMRPAAFFLLAIRHTLSIAL